MSDSANPDPVTRLNAALEGRYRIEREIGEGGMATVYLADDLKHERRVAVKVLRSELAALVGAERFLAEIKTTANLQHPHILPLFDSGDADGFLFYVMPYVEGESLREKLDREKQLSVEDALALTRKVADALDYAHGQGVVHRDIKPANILLSGRGEPLVADFGIALAVAQAGGGRLTETGLSLGTPHYMSPEQATGDRDVDPRSDVYALGCVLYEMLTGEPPFSASTAQAILAKILTMDAPSVTMMRRTVPPNVGAALAKALEKLPADRFASAAEFASALADQGFTHEARAKTQAPDSIPDAAAGQVPAATPGPWKRLAMATTALAFLFAALAARGWLRSAPPPTPADVARFTIQPSADAPLSLVGVYQDLTISPDGRLIVYKGPVPDLSGPQLYVRALDDLVGAPLRGTAGGYNPVVSPDGAWVAFVVLESETTLQRVSTLGGTPLTLAEAPNSILGMSWGADDQIVFGTRRGPLFRVPAAGGVPEPLTALDPEHDDEEHLWPSVIPGRNAVVFTTSAFQGNPVDNGQLAVLDLDTGQIIRLGVEGFSPKYVSTGHLVYAVADGSVRAVPFDAASLSVTGSPVPLVEGVALKGSGAADFAVSDGGHLVYALGEFVTGAPRSLLWVDRDGREESIAAPPRNYVYPRISPDGRRVALDARDVDADIWIWDFAGETLTRMILGDGVQNYPVWTPDGERIAYTSDRGVGWKASNNTGDAGLLAERPGAGPALPSLYFFTPDGTAIVLRDQENPETRDDLLLLPVEGDRPPAPLLNGAFDERNAELSPDGRWMAYQSDESGAFEIYVRPFPEVGGNQVQVSNAGGTRPLWSPDGRELFFLQPTGTINQLVSVSVDADAGGPFSFGERAVILEWPYFTNAEGRTYDVSPDGSRFLVISVPIGIGGESPEITVVLNWFEELRERLGP